MQLSRRLSAVAKMVTPGYRLADIGTDHGYVPIYLVSEKRIPSAVAMDVNRGPLERAREHIAGYGLEPEIETRLSDGLAQLQPGEADAVLIAGMGGMLTIRILERGGHVLPTVRELILQPQSDIRQVRYYLYTHGYRITSENMVEEDGKYYPMMHVVRDLAASLNGAAISEKAAEFDKAGISCESAELSGTDIPEETALRYGPCLLAEKHPVLRRYLEQEHVQLTGLRERLSSETKAAARARQKEIAESIRQNEAAQAAVRGAAWTMEYREE